MSLRSPDMSPTAFFETPRLRVRLYDQADLDAFVAYRAHPVVERYQSWTAVYSQPPPRWLQAGTSITMACRTGGRWPTT